MPHHCYICGSAIDPDKRHLRRKVRTGESVRKRFPSGAPVSARYSTGFRVVCPRCAVRIDIEQGGNELAMWIEFGAAALFLVGLFFASLLK